MGKLRWVRGRRGGWKSRVSRAAVPARPWGGFCRLALHAPWALPKGDRAA